MFDIAECDFCPPHTLPHPSFPEMSKPSLSSLLIKVTELTTQFAALSARLDSLVRQDALTVPVAPAEVKTKKAPKQKDPDAPKRAPGAYILFCQAERSKTPDVKLKLEEAEEEKARKELQLERDTAVLRAEAHNLLAHSPDAWSKQT